MILEYMERLLSNQESREDSLEYLCVLLTVIGKNLEISHHRDALDNVFEEFERLSEDRTTLKPRIRFMLLDLIELRKVKNFTFSSQMLSRLGLDY